MPESRPSQIILWARNPQNGTYLPIRTFNIDALQADGWGDDYAFSFIGQSSQLIIAPSADEDIIPQEASPVQDLNCETGGNPLLISRSEVENVTVFFATGHSNV